MDRKFSCRQFEQALSAYVDGQLPATVRQQVSFHSDHCTKCRELQRTERELRAVLASMPKVKPPANLAMQLRVSASRELARRRENRTWWQERAADLRLWKDNLMRPFAIPAFGGVGSAILLFCMIAPLVARNVDRTSLDVPTGLYTEASVKGVLPLGLDAEDVDVELTIDENGNMIDYRVGDDLRSEFAKSPSMQRNLESHLLTMKFNPATAFGQPVNAKIRLTFRNTRVDVKG
jgi:hypothetical protein